MVSLRGSFRSGIPAQKDYGVYREFIKVIQEAIEGRRVLQLLYHPRDQSPAERKVNPYAVHLCRISDCTDQSRMFFFMMC